MAARGGAARAAGRASHGRARRASGAGAARRPAGIATPERRPAEVDAATDPILTWQRAVGNRAVQRRLGAGVPARPIGHGPVAAPPLASLTAQRDGAAPHEDPRIKTRADAIARIWGDTGRTDRKELILAQLRRTDLPRDAASEEKLTALLKQIFADDPDTCWLALMLQRHGPEPLWEADLLAKRRRHSLAPASGVIGQSSGLVKGSTPAPITAFFFPGRSDERALVIGGVHGSELSGIEVANRLVKRLQEQSEQKQPMPYFTTIVVPELFPDTAAQARRRPAKKGEDSNVGREVAVPRTAGKGTKELPPARQFPPPGKGLSDLEAAGGPTDAAGKRLQDEEGVLIPLMAEAKALLALIERFKPSRIASVHAHRFDETKGAKKGTDAPGIFVDPRGGFDETVDPAFPKRNKGKLTDTSSPITATTKEGQADDALALAMAKAVAAKGKAAKVGGTPVPGNHLGAKDGPAVVHYADSAGHPEGFSLGAWGPSRGMTVITVEVAHYGESGGDATRAAELQAHGDALRDIFLEQP